MAVVWHGFTQMAAYPDNTPVIVDHAEGRELVDVDGRRYLDAISSLWVTTLGHRVPELDQALRRQLDRVAHSTLLGHGNRVVVELAEALAAVVPVDSPHFLFASDGASSVEQALKIALQYWVNTGVDGRTRYVALGNAYHGDTVGSLSLGDGGFGTDLFDPVRFPVIRTPGYDDPGWADKAVAAVERHAGELAAVVIEPLVQGAAGISSPTRLTWPAWLRPVAGPASSSSPTRWPPASAAPAGSSPPRVGHPARSPLPGQGPHRGYLPMSATVASDAVYRAFLGEDLGPRTFYHGHSFAGNALAAAVALEHLRLIERDDVLANVTARAAHSRPC